MTFTDLPEGNYQVIATKEGYTSHVIGTNINYALDGARYSPPVPDEPLWNKGLEGD